MDPIHQALCIQFQIHAYAYASGCSTSLEFCDVGARGAATVRGGRGVRTVGSAVGGGAAQAAGCRLHAPPFAIQMAKFSFIAFTFARSSPLASPAAPRARAARPGRVRRVCGGRGQRHHILSRSSARVLLLRGGVWCVPCGSGPMFGSHVVRHRARLVWVSVKPDRTGSPSPVSLPPPSFHDSFAH